MLRSTDKKKGTAYLKTLDSYFTNDFSIKGTSENLFCHVNTVHYRLERIKQLLNLDLNNVELQIALKLAKFYYPELF
ncbi:MAG: helix-turn-helix domain-containing protein [Peptococcaceae bacterium]|nr:helix-turn-helix domain-containing protein [Peptococcaceae bacterium]